MIIGDNAAKLLIVCCMAVMTTGCGGGGSSSGSGTAVSGDKIPEQERLYPSKENRRPELPIGQSAEGTLSADTYDQYPVTLEAGMLYAFTVSGKTTGGGTLINPAIRLMKQEDGIDEFSDDLAYFTTVQQYRVDPEMPFVAPVSGSYLLRISGFDDGDTSATYKLSARAYSLETDIIPALIDFRWNASVPHGTPTALAYCFFSRLDQADPTDAGLYTGFVAMTADQQAAVGRGLQDYSESTNLTFTKQTDCSTAQLRFGTANLAILGSAGATEQYLLPSSNILAAEDVFMDAGLFAQVQEGMPNFGDMLHETGHALGLKHPGNYSGSTGSGVAPFITPAFDNYKYTLMSYVEKDINGEDRQRTAGIFDIAALQWMYGANQSGTGTSHTYAFVDGTRYFGTLTTNASADTIDAGGMTTDVRIYLAGGTFSSVGLTADGAPAHDNVAIPFGATVHDAIGGARNDYLVGNELDNVLSGEGGNDTLDGAGGTNTALYAGVLANFTIKKQANGAYTVTALTGNEGADTLINIQLIKFSDTPQAVAIDSVLTP